MPIPDRQKTRRLVREVVYDQFRDGIITGELAPGMRLDDAWLQEWLGASRTPVREAIGRLGREGLLDVRPQRGTHVAPLDVHALTDRISVVSALVAATACQVVPLLREEQDAGLLRIRSDLPASDLRSPAVLELPEFIIASYGSRLMARLVNSLTPHIRRALHAVAGHPAAAIAVDDLREAIDSALGRDQGAAVAAVQRHYAAVAEMINEQVGVASKGSGLS